MCVDKKLNLIKHAGLNFYFKRLNNMWLIHECIMSNDLENSFLFTQFLRYFASEYEKY